jgi:phage terminase large subunit
VTLLTPDGTLEIPTPRAFLPLLENKRYKGAFGGRGSGKSHFFAELAIEEAVSMPGLRFLCVREIQKSLKQSVRQLLIDKMETLGVRGHFEIREEEIRSPGGGLFTFQGMQNHTADTVKSFEGYSRAWAEEAHTMSARSKDLLFPTIRAPGSQIWASWNPENDTDPIDVHFRKDPPENSVCVEVSHLDNPWFPEDLRADMLSDYRRDPDKAAWVWGGEYRTASEARIFRNFRSGDVSVPHNVRWFYGVDWGFSVDPTAAVRVCFPSPQVLYVSDELHEVGVPTDRLPKWLEDLPGSKDWPMAADSARPETIDYVRRHGYLKLRPAAKGQGSVEDGINFLQGFDIVVSPRCPNTLREFQRYAYKIDKQTDEILPIVVDDWNHGIDAIRYATERLHRKGKLIMPILPEKRTEPVDYARHDDDADSWKVA